MSSRSQDLEHIWVIVCKSSKGVEVTGTAGLGGVGPYFSKMYRPFAADAGCSSKQMVALPSIKIKLTLTVCDWNTGYF